MAVTPSNLKWRPAQVNFNGVDVGGTLGDVILTITADEGELKADQLGTGAAEITRLGLAIEVITPMAEITLDNFKLALGDDKAKVLLLKPLSGGIPTVDTNRWITANKAYPKANISTAFSIANQQVIEVTYACLPNEANANTRLVIGTEAATA